MAEEETVVSNWFLCSRFYLWVTAAGPGIGSLGKCFWFSLFNPYVYWLSSCGHLAGGGDLAWWLDKGLTTSNPPSHNMGPCTWAYHLESPKQRSVYVWYVKSLPMSSSLNTVVRELAKYWLDLVWVKEVKRDESSTELAEVCTLVYRKGNENHHRGIWLLVHEWFQHFRE
jgi:hypothetical protein